MPAPKNAPAAAVEKARRHYRLRRMRDQEFGPTLFGEPAWDLLLDLYIAASDPSLSSVMGGSIAASASTKVAAPWLRLLEDHGLVERLNTGTDMSRPVFTISQGAFDRMTLLLTDSPDAITLA